MTVLAVVDSSRIQELELLSAIVSVGFLTFLFLHLVDIGSLGCKPAEIQSHENTAPTDDEEKRLLSFVMLQALDGEALHAAPPVVSL